jgi:hypothetical protein
MRRLLILTVMTVAIVGNAATTSATTIVLNTDNTDGSANYVGLIDPGVPPNPSNQVPYINFLIGLGATTSVFDPITGQTYTRSDLAGPFPTALLPEVQKKDDYVDGDPTTIVATASFTYLVAKYDNEQAGSLVWYLSGVSGDTYVVPTKLNNKGLSGITMYNAGDIPDVPDGGATLGLLGLAMLGVGYLRRRGL